MKMSRVRQGRRLLLAKDTAFPEFWEDCEKRIAGLRTLVARARKYGVDVYLYMNEPRAGPVSFFEARPGRASMRGVPRERDEIQRLCTSNPEVQSWMSDALAAVFTQVPGLGKNGLLPPYPCGTGSDGRGEISGVSPCRKN